LSRLEKAAGEAAEPGPPGETTAVYDRLREDARARIGRDLEIGEKPLYWIDGKGAIHATDDDSFVRHEGDYERAIDRDIARLECEIDKERANMSAEELAQHRAWKEEDDARLAHLSLDEKIEALKAEIAALAVGEGEGVDS
jgi:hypothetical protein